ncbi:hypothetical protein [Rhizobium sp. 42MFCr.1]|uniref:hypothetical protein n=1 Tax=Rhizobium sp. 42MFCr.1 TaxID=1048680 RepID=UPI00037C5795|nr:hypothetical protein [Rhizobium sp. 42MFCr.1]
MLSDQGGEMHRERFSLHAMEAALDRAAAVLRRRKAIFHALAKTLFDDQAMDEAAVLQILTNDNLSPKKARDLPCRPAAEKYGENESEHHRQPRHSLWRGGPDR